MCAMGARFAAAVVLCGCLVAVWIGVGSASSPGSSATTTSLDPFYVRFCRDNPGAVCPGVPRAPMLIGEGTRELLVARLLRQILAGARDAPRPPTVDMRLVAPFAWTRLFVFSGETSGQMRDIVRRTLGVRWRYPPETTGCPADERTCPVVLAFATSHRVVTAVGRRDFAPLGCLAAIARGLVRSHTRFKAYRSAGAPADPAAGLPASPPSVIVLPTTFSKQVFACSKGFGVLH